MERTERVELQGAVWIIHWKDKDGKWVEERSRCTSREEAETLLRKRRSTMSTQWTNETLMYHYMAEAQADDDSDWG